MRRHLRTWILVSLAVGVVTLGVVMWWRSYPPMLALFSGLATGALTFVTFTTIYRLRQQLEVHRR